MRLDVLEHVQKSFQLRIDPICAQTALNFCQTSTRIPQRFFSMCIATTELLGSMFGHEIVKGPQSGIKRVHKSKDDGNGGNRLHGEALSDSFGEAEWLTFYKHVSYGYPLRRYFRYPGRLAYISANPGFTILVSGSRKSIFGPTAPFPPFRVYESLQTSLLTLAHTQEILHSKIIQTSINKPSHY